MLKNIAVIAIIIDSHCRNTYNAISTHNNTNESNDNNKRRGLLEAFDK